MDSIYKLIIDKGGDFGILCVVILIISTGLIKTLKSKKRPSAETKTPSNDPTIHLLQFIKVFSIISVIGIFTIKIFVVVDNSKTMDLLIKNNAHKLASDTVRVDSSSLERTFQLSETAALHFHGNGRLYATLKNDSSSANQGAYDTLFDVAINDIKGFTIYHFESIFVISYKFDAPNVRIRFTDQFKTQDFVEFVYVMNKNGYQIDLGTNTFRLQSIIGFIIAVLGVLFYFFLRAGAMMGMDQGIRTAVCL
jgi:hypothetical protein